MVGKADVDRDLCHFIGTLFLEGRRREKQDRRCTPSNSFDDSQHKAPLVASAPACSTRLHPEKARDSVTWADACLAAGFLARRKNLRVSLLGVALLLQFAWELLGLRRSQLSPAVGEHGHASKWTFACSPAPKQHAAKTGRQDHTVAIGVAASGRLLHASLARALYQNSAHRLSDQLLFPLHSCGV